MPAPAKKKPGEIDPRRLTEPLLSDEEWDEYLRGWSLFNNAEFWHAHEAWENVWKRCEEDSRIFFQGIIQLTAALHLLVGGQRFEGMMRNLEKAEKKLLLFPPRFLGVDVAELLSSVGRVRETTAGLGPDRLCQFDQMLLPRVTVSGERPPSISRSSRTIS